MASAQGSLEYLLIIGGAIIVAGIIIGFLISTNFLKPDTTCFDGIDNDGDGLTDMHDPKCIASKGKTELPEQTQPTCGNLTCETGENCSNCPADCGACPSCGDGNCNGSETCSSCQTDCGACPICGNGTCEAAQGENHLTCQADCPTYCGDNIITNPNSEGQTEQCDGTDFGGQTCQTMGYTGGNPTCTSNCTIDPSTCTGAACSWASGDCGTGANLGKRLQTCGPTGCTGTICTAGQTQYVADPTCSTSCNNNNFIDPGEQCDGTALGGKTCVDFGKTGTGLTCASCNFDTSACTGGSGGGGTIGSTWIKLKNPLVAASFEELISNITNFIFWVILALIPLAVLIAAFYFLTAAGSPQKVATARNILLYAAIGLAISLFAKALVSVIRLVLGG